jgi:hypothetical protein
VAQNPNPELPAASALYCAATGGGKTYRVQRAIAKAERVVLWDPDEDYQRVGRLVVRRARSVREFHRLLRAAVASGKRYAVAYSGRDSADAFDAFAAMVWAIADGSRPVDVVLEELADVTRSGHAHGDLARLIRKGRKFGLRIHAVTQRVAEIPITIRSQVHAVHCGVQKDPRDREAMARLLDVEIERVARLRARQWIVREGAEPARPG